MLIYIVQLSNCNIKFSVQRIIVIAAVVNEVQIL